MRRVEWLLLCGVLGLWMGCGSRVAEEVAVVQEESEVLEKAEGEGEVWEASNRAVVRVNVTSQAYDFLRPWLKRAPFTRSALGVVLEGGLILVTAELVANHNVIELELAESGEKAPAELVAVDYQSNLALVRAKQNDFSAALRPMKVTGEAGPGDRVQIWQLEANGLLVETGGTVTTVALDQYPDEVSYLMTYRVAVSLQYRDSSFVVPVVLHGRLAGLLTRYDTKTQSGQAIAGPIIQAFLARVETLPEPIFPVVAIQYASLRDPELQAWVKLPEGKTGVFLTEVMAGSWAEAAGLRRGDVILAIDDLVIDQDGNYHDPQHGKLELEHLLSGGAEVGQVRVFRLWREGEEVRVEAKLTGKKASDYVSPPFVVDAAPDYEVLGGLVFLELSRQFLKQWGQNWRTAAPQRLVFLDGFQGEIFGAERRRVVFLGQVLPSRSMLGFEGLGHLEVTRINGKEIRSLGDLRLALQKPENGFHKIEFHESPRMIFVDAEEAKAEEPQVRRAFRIPPRR